MPAKEADDELVPVALCLLGMPSLLPLPPPLLPASSGPVVVVVVVVIVVVDELVPDKLFPSELLPETAIAIVDANNKDEVDLQNSS